MRVLIRVFFIFFCLASIVFFLYGSIKMYRAEHGAGSSVIFIDSGIPGVEATIKPKPMGKEKAQQIILFSVIVFFISILGIILTFTYKKNKHLPPDVREKKHHS